MANTIDIFQDGMWKEASVLGETEVTLDEKIDTVVTYLEPVSNRLVTCLKSSLPYKDEDEAKAVRASAKESNQ